MKLHAPAPRWSAFVCGLLLVAEAGASGHFDVDDAGTLDVDQCLVEAWAGRVRSPATQGFQHLGGACAVGRVEVGLNLDRAASPDAATVASGGPQVKWTFLGREPDAAWSAAATLAATVDLRHGGRPGGQFVLPLSWRVSDPLSIHVNVGTDWATRSGVATARRGAALEWACTERLTLIAERHRSVDLWTSRLGARITVAPLTSIDVSVSRSGPVDGGRQRSVVIGFNREFSRD